MNNRIDGIRFEADLCEKLSDHGFFAINLTQNPHGQPADIVAVKNNKAILIDCKECLHDSFKMERIEPNQETAWGMWKYRGCTDYYYAFRDSKERIFIVHMADLLKRRDEDGVKVISNVGIFQPWEEWLCEHK